MDPWLRDGVPVEADELRRHLAGLSEVRVELIGDDRALPGTLRPAAEALELALDGPCPEPEGTALVEFELGRWAWRLDAAVRGASPGGLLLGWPRGALRRDRRRFERVARPGDGYALLLVDAEPRAVDLVDVSPNGAAFRDPSPRPWRLAERVPVEVRLGDGSPASARFEVRGLEPAGRGHLVRGRFLPPSEEPHEEGPLPEGLAAALARLVAGLAVGSGSR